MLIGTSLNWTVIKTATFVLAATRGYVGKDRATTKMGYHFFPNETASWWSSVCLSEFSCPERGRRGRGGEEERGRGKEEYRAPWSISFVDVLFIHCEFASCVYVHEWKWICKVRIKYLKKDIAQCRHHG